MSLNATLETLWREKILFNVGMAEKLDELFQKVILISNQTMKFNMTELLCLTHSGPSFLVQGEL